LLDGLFDHPAGFFDGICGPLQGCIPGVSKLFFNGLVGRVSHEDFYGTVDPLLCSSPFVKCEV